jgi:hypothetical protein
MEDNMKEITYGFVDSQNILKAFAVFIEGDVDTLSRVKEEYGYENAYPMNLEKETTAIDETFWNGSRFVHPSPMPSWIFDDEINDWKPPISKPDAGFWTWDESTVSWIEPQPVIEKE